MKIRKFLIAGGNSTALVWDCSEKDRLKVAKEYLKEVEQVGFVSEEAGLPKLVMMGNELCVNGTIALASLLSEGESLYTSGLSSKVKYKNNDNRTCIELALSFKREGSIILFEGIGYKCVERAKEMSKNIISKLAQEYKLPAFGIVVYDDNKIRPYVYVRDTDSLVEETACGSGSIAVSIIIERKDIIQPTGEIISVSKKDKSFVICTIVEEVE